MDSSNGSNTSIKCQFCNKNYKNKPSLRKHNKKCKSIITEDTNIKTIINAIKSIDLDTFNIENYITIINKKILNLLKKSKYNDDIIEDELLDNFIKNNTEGIRFSKKLKQLQMNVGNIWQVVIGNYDKFEDLGQGHKTGLDIKSDSLKIIIELKNRYNTDNASAKKANLDKLCKFKKENPEWQCIYAIVNDKTKAGKHEKLLHNDFELTYLSGQKLMDFIFGKDKTHIIDNVKKQMLNV